MLVPSDPDLGRHLWAHHFQQIELRCHLEKGTCVRGISMQRPGVGNLFGHRQRTCRDLGHFGLRSQLSK